MIRLPIVTRCRRCAAGLTRAQWEALADPPDGPQHRMGRQYRVHRPGCGGLVVVVLRELVRRGAR